MENIKEKIEEIVDKVKNDPDFATKFQENPVKAAEEIVGVDLPDDKINGMLDAIQAKINLDNASGIFGKIKGMFD